MRKINQLLFLVTILLLTSCSNDFYEEQIKNSNKSMKMLNRSEIDNLPKLTSKLNQIKLTQNKIQERIVTDTTYNFSVDTNSAIYISSETSETYTFNVIRENSDNKIENLILIANSDSTFRTFLIKYNFTNSDKETTGFNPNNYESPKYTEIEADYTQLINSKCLYRSDFICVDTYEYERIETNSGYNAGGALFYWDWRVVATNCTFVTQSSGCGGGDSNLILTFETSPIHTNGGYSGVTVALSTNQRTFINTLNLASSENFGIMNGDVQMSILNYVNTLTNGQISELVYFFNNANTFWICDQLAETQQSIFNYLIANNFSTQSRNFINELVTFCNNNLNNEESKKHIVANIIEKQITDSNLDPCGKSVLNKLKNLQQSDIAKILTKLGSNSVYNLTISSANPVDPTALGETNWAIDTSGYVIQYNYLMTIHPAQTAGSSDLAIACTLLHEIVHAYFLSLIDDCSQTSNCTQLQSFQDLWNFYVANQNSGIYTNNVSQHNQIANSYVNILASALQEFVTGVPVGNGQQVMQVYSDVSWIGLIGTIPYNALSQVDKDRINFRWDNVELLNQTATNSSGIIINPVGSRTSPCN